MDNKYQKIIHYLQNEIDAGKFKPGARLPSIRETSQLLNCNKATVIRAYMEMEQNHLIYSIPKSGYYLIDQKKLDSQASNVDQIDFSTATPDPSLFPYRDFQHCLNQAIDTYRESLFSYLYAPGLPSLCQILSRFLQDYQIFTPPENIFITAGSQQALHILANIPFPNGKSNILVEQPTYFGMVRCCQVANATTIGIERTGQGIDLEELERIFSNGNIKYFYTIPRFHNPLGTSYTNLQKKQIVQLAQKYNVYIVEDDYLADLEVDTKSDPMFAYDTTGKVIYVRTFSKTVMPGLRLGVAVLPKLLVNSFKEYKSYTDLSTSILSQGALEVYIKSGMFENHLKKIRNLYRERMDALKKACQTYLPKELNPNIPSTGFFTCFELSFKAKRLESVLEVRKIKVVNIEGMYLQAYQKDNMLRLSVCRTDSPKIEQGIFIIGQAIGEMIKKPTNFEPENYYQPIV